MTSNKTIKNYPLSSTQKEIWFDQILHPELPLYNIGGYLRIDGTIDQALFEKALNQVIKENDALRIRLHEGKSLPTQTFAENICLKLDFYEFEDKENAHELALAWMKQAFAKPFQIYDNPLFQFALFKIATNRYYSFQKYHHLIVDGWAISLVVQRVSAAYNALASGQFCEQKYYTYQYFIQNDQVYLDSERFTKAKHYWLEKYHEIPEPLMVRRYAAQFADKTIPSQRSILHIKRSFYNQLIEFAKENKASTFQIILGALYCYFLRTGNRDDLSIGLHTLNRNNAAFKQTVGMFMNLIPVWFRFSTELSFVELIQAIRMVLQRDYRNQRLPLSEIYRGVGFSNVGFPNKNRQPLFDLVLSYEKHDYEVHFNGSPAEAISFAHGFEQNVLAVFIREFHDEQDVRVDFDYSLGAFHEDEIELVKARFKFLLGEILRWPSVPIRELQLMPDAELKKILIEFNETTVDYPRDKTLVDLFEEQVAKTPENVAVVFEKQQLSYQQLNAKANQLAHYLMTLGVKAETLVGICVERSLEMVIGLLGILKAGCAYVPLSPDYPEERLQFILEDSEVKVLLSQSHLLERLSFSTAKVVDLEKWEKFAGYSGENQVRLRCPENLAYVIYTSGSTGKPKGVIITHDNVNNAYHAWSIAYQLQDIHSHLQMANYAFDVFTGDWVRALCSGSRLVLCPSELLINPARLYKLMVEEQIECAEFIPFVIRQLLEYLNNTNQSLQFLKCCIVGSDTWYMKEYEELLARCSTFTKVINSYGVTEATIDSIYFENTAAVKLSPNVPIGKPFSNTQIYILNANHTPTPLGIPGELCIAGAGLARGYLNRPELTAEKFIEIEVFGKPQRLYKTGDLARWLPDGNLEYLGRLDHQVSLRGFRIELSEIEVTLSQHEAVKEAVVVLYNQSDNPRLVAYVTLVIKTDEVSGILRTWLKTRLPEYMLPASFTVLDKLPLTPNGKIDRKALPAPDALSTNKHYQAPRDTVELQLAQIWENVLEVHPIGINDNFFELGGHSLLAIRLMVQIEQQFNKHLPLATLFQGATIEQLANQLRLQTDSQTWSSLVAIQPNGTKPPFFCVPGIGGNVLYFYELAHHLGPEQPVYGLQAVGLSGKSVPFTRIEDMAAHYFKELQTIQPQEPYLLGGHSFGGLVAFEMSLQLQNQGHEVAFLGIFDMFAPPFTAQGIKWDETQWLHKVALFIERELGQKLEFDYDILQSLDADAQLDYLNKQLKQAGCLPPNAPKTQLRGLVNVFKANSQIHYAPSEITKTPITFFKAKEARSDVFENEPTLGWQKFSESGVSVQIVPGDHFTMLKKPHVQILAAQLKEALEQTEYKL
ncbi:MAG: non-ribosomal peptide synthetase [Candidatus Parabeggiatoa sp. nov. 1]|nr:MAG: non-ribosomal peptide synthetase [Gammaproteobacteria bacterium]